MKKAISPKPRFRTQFNYMENPTPGSTNTGESKCQPDMSLTVRQLMQNHTRGMGLGVPEKKGIYSETDVPYFDDITEMHEYMEHLKEQEKTLKAEIEAEVKKAKEAAEKAKKEKEAPTPPPVEKPSEKGPE